MRQDVLVGPFIKGNIAPSGIFVFMFLSICFVSSKSAFGFFQLHVVLCKAWYEKASVRDVTKEAESLLPEKNGSGQGQEYY